MTSQKTDDIALKRAMEIASQDPLRNQQLDSMLQDRDWFEVASFAAGCVQSRVLGLKPWQEPPCVCNADGDDRDKQGQALLRKMLRAGVSRYDPDPLAALTRKRSKSCQRD